MNIRGIRFVKSAESMDQMPDEEFPEIAFAGRSNVGKSALLNMLARRNALARISSKPGKTQTFNFYCVNEGIYFVDIPGYGYAKVSKKKRAQWQRRIGAYLTGRTTLSLVLHLVDSRHPPTSLDKEIMLLLCENQVQSLLVLTKADKLSGNGITRSIQRVRKDLTDYGMELPIIVTSALGYTGRDELLERIGNALPAAS